jgi:soluble lytic murein transglycosylase-like protein
MRFCLRLGCAGLAAGAWLAAATPEVTTPEASQPEAPAAKLASVVRADRRTGRLVRKVTVAPPAAPKPVKASLPAPQPVERAVGAAIADSVEKTAGRYQVDPLLVHSVIAVESNYNPLAVSPKGAQGLMQLMPGTARRLEVKDSFDAIENLDGGVRYLKYLLTVFGEEDPRLALAAYNAGEGAVMKHRGIPPYPETERYVERVGQKYGEAKRAAQAAAVPKETPVAEHPAIEQYVDAEGRLHVRTRSSP